MSSQFDPSAVDSLVKSMKEDLEKKLGEVDLVVIGQSGDKIQVSVKVSPLNPLTDVHYYLDRWAEKAKKDSRVNLECDVEQAWE